jgi:hypothetical protein
MPGPWDQEDRHGPCVRADDGPHDLWAVVVVLGVVGGIDCRVHIDRRCGEGDVSFDAAGADTSDAAGNGAAIPRVVGPGG